MCGSPGSKYAFAAHSTVAAAAVVLSGYSRLTGIDIGRFICPTPKSL